MVQRLSLMGVVSQDELPIVLRSLEAISGMQGNAINSRTQVYEPKYRFVAQTPQSAQTEQYKLFVVFNNTNECHVETREMPEAGRNIKVISQAVNSSIIKEGDVNSLMELLGYEQKKEYECKGLEFILHKNLVVHLFQILSKGELVDQSGQYVVDAFVEVDLVTDLHAVEVANQLLLNTQLELKGVIGLTAPQRQSFNTRMPRVQS